MNHYERIQQAIDYLEDRLTGEVKLGEAAKAAGMSTANLYRLFFATTGHTVKEYIRKRRLSMASIELAGQEAGILETALKYGFESNESFSRAYKKVCGELPSVSKRSGMPFEFRRSDVLERYLGGQDEAVARKYPEIKVLKELPEMRVAAFRYYGTDPESHEWADLAEWLRGSRLLPERDGLRFFGFDNPGPSPGKPEYGYEIRVTLPPGYSEEGEGVQFLTMPGGLYAVMNVEGDGAALPAAWSRFSCWVRESKYEYGGHQWLEEHLGITGDFRHEGSIDLYFPIQLSGQKLRVELREEAPMQVAVVRSTGKQAIRDGRLAFGQWAPDGGLRSLVDGGRWLGFFRRDGIGREDFWYEAGVTLHADTAAGRSGLMFRELPGGLYGVTETVLSDSMETWRRLIRWLENNGEFAFGSHPFYEEYYPGEEGLLPTTRVHLFMPLARRNGRE
jgi:AraC family transcriptional regulator